ncbi:MarR family transcriptional regulator, partial [Streptomyces sp. RP5T]
PVEQPPPQERNDLPRRKPGNFFRLRNGTPQ